MRFLYVFLVILLIQLVIARHHRERERGRDRERGPERNRHEERREREHRRGESGEYLDSKPARRSEEDSDESNERNTRTNLKLKDDLQEDARGFHSRKNLKYRESQESKPDAKKWDSEMSKESNTGGKDDEDDDDEDDEISPTEKANQFVDFVLNSFGSTVVSKKLQPLSLLDPPTKKIELPQELFGSASGFSLHNVSIARGLETITRVGQASLSTMEKGDKLIRILKFTIQMKNVEVHSNMSVKMMEIGPDVKFIGRTRKIVIQIRAAILTDRDRKGKKQDNDFKVKLLGLKIVELKPMKFDVQGMWGLFNNIIKGAAKVVMDVFKKPINKNIERKMKKAMAKLINKGLRTSTSKSIFGMAIKFL